MIDNVLLLIDWLSVASGQTCWSGVSAKKLFRVLQRLRQDHRLVHYQFVSSLHFITTEAQVAELLQSLYQQCHLDVAEEETYILAPEVKPRLAKLRGQICLKDQIAFTELLSYIPMGPLVPPPDIPSWIEYL